MNIDLNTIALIAVIGVVGVASAIAFLFALFKTFLILVKGLTKLIMGVFAVSALVGPIALVYNNADTITDTMLEEEITMLEEEITMLEEEIRNAPKAIVVDARYLNPSSK